MSATVYVTGANGFIAQHLVKALLAKNHKVIGTVRSEIKGKNLASLLNNRNFKYVIVSDINAKDAFDKSLANNPDTSIVFHTASPVILDSKNLEDGVLNPAINGTINMLASIKKFGGNVRRVVFTSSSAAFCMTPGFDYTNKVFSEDSWTDITREKALENGFDAYVGSKTLAEKAAWSFVKTESPQFELSVVAPNYTFGPQAFDAEVKDKLQPSVEVINRYLKLKPSDQLPRIESYFSDIDDVVTAHLIAGESKEAANQRLLLAFEKFNHQLIVNTIRENFPQYKDTIPKGDPKFAIEGLKNFKPGTADISRTLEILNFVPKSLTQSIIDTVAQIVKVQAE